MKMGTVGGCHFNPGLSIKKIFSKRLDFLLRQSYSHDNKTKYALKRTTKKNKEDLNMSKEMYCKIMNRIRSLAKNSEVEPVVELNLVAGEKICSTISNFEMNEDYLEVWIDAWENNVAKFVFVPIENIVSINYLW